MLDLLAAGELNVDLILAGLPSLPVSGRELLAKSCALCLGSSTAITACAAASIGLSVGFAGRVGADAYAEVVLNGLRRWGVDTSRVTQKSEYETGITVSMACKGDRAMVTHLGDTIASLTAEEIDLTQMPAKHLHVGSYFLQTSLRIGLPGLFQRARALGMTTSLDAGWDDSGEWTPEIRKTLLHTDFFFPNEEEAARLTGEATSEAAARSLAAYGCTAVVKRGSKGSLLCTPEGERLSHVGYPAHALDATGAGDSFNAGFLYAYLRGEPLQRCLMFGNASGSVCVSRMGGTTACPTLSDLLAKMNG